MINSLQDAAACYAQTWVGSGGQSTEPGLASFAFLEEEFARRCLDRTTLSMFVMAYTQAYMGMLEATEEKPVFRDYMDFFAHRFKDEPDAELILGQLVKSRHRHKWHSEPTIHQS